MIKTFEEEFNYLIELSGKVLIGQVDAEKFEENRVAFFEKYNTRQQQALPVVPEDVAKWIEDLKSKGYGPLKNPGTYGEAISDLSDESLEKILTWISQHQEEFMRAWLDGYTVEKPQLFYLKHIDMSKNNEHMDYWFSKKGYEHVNTPKGSLPKNFGYLMGYGIRYLKFTQQEIDSMQTGSYEQIKVEDH